ncbi:MYND domain protein [Penicillium waksmanii]|uniref:MYND domain protein n=1 Tax=Penicillium waksmanii TaxID=69791 RepID=UPI002548F1D3|nr:MYND domain protein [Penicillium waksmanii]KAJ5988442.1 MYND domain protein [Penicillium waksmanii]
MADPDPLQLLEICTNCRKPETKVNPLKSCGKCKITPYCSRDCQKSDWKSYKKSCAQSAHDRAERIENIKSKLASATASVVDSLAPTSGVESTEETNKPQSSSSSAPNHTSAASNPDTAKALDKGGPALTVKITDPFQKLKEKKWLHDRPKEDIYKLLIDAFRLRMDDDFKFLELRHANTIYDDISCDGTPSLELFIRMAVLYPVPEWWNESELASCLEYAKLLTWSNIMVKITADDVKAYYGDPSMVLQLRIFAEQVVEKGGIGIDFLSMLDVGVMLERSHEFLNYVHRPMEVEAEVGEHY